MRNKKTIIGIAIFVAILVLGVGYAAISGVELSIAGTAEMKNVDLDVFFTETKSVDVGTTNATVVATPDVGGLTAEIEVTDLERVNDTVTATYTIKNNETDVAAEITQGTITVDKSEYFQVTTDIGSGKVIQPQQTTTVTVTVTVIKTPILDTNSSTSIEVLLEADPVEPTP